MLPKVADLEPVPWSSARSFIHEKKEPILARGPLTAKALATNLLENRGQIRSTWAAVSPLGSKAVPCSETPFFLSF